jgi:hypothetical protein
MQTPKQTLKGGIKNPAQGQSLTKCVILSNMKQVFPMFPDSGLARLDRLKFKRIPKGSTTQERQTVVEGTRAR